MSNFDSPAERPPGQDNGRLGAKGAKFRFTYVHIPITIMLRWLNLQRYIHARYLIRQVANVY